MYVALITCMYLSYIMSCSDQHCQLEVKSKGIIIGGGVISMLEAKPLVPFSSAQLAVVESSGTYAR